MRSSVAVAIACLSVVGMSAADDAAAAVRKSTQIAAQGLGPALQMLAKERGFQVVYISDEVNPLHTQGASGELTPEEALTQLLQGTGMTFRYFSENAVSIQRIRLAQATAPAADATADASGIEFDEVVVTGSRLSRSAVEGPVPVNVYTREDIDRSGQATVTDFLNTLPEVSTSTTENGTVFSGQTTVRLRGLPLGTTLVLINGRRVESGGGTAFFGGYIDLNSIPAAVIERIEVVPEGSSAVYGSDALAGVVNIILKKDFEGLQANARYGAASGITEAATDLAWGKTWERGSFSIVGSYYDRGELLGTERSNSSSIDLPADVVERCSPGNVYSVDGSNLPGLAAASAGVRAGAHNAPALSDFNAGQLNKCRYSYDADLIPPSQRASVFAYGSFRATAGIELFTELMYTHQKQDVSSGHRALYSQLVPASNAYNPFGVDVLVNYKFTTPAAEYSDHDATDFIRPLVGARGRLADSWDWEVSAWLSRSKLSLSTSAALTDYAKRDAALASSDPSTALNLFTAGAAGSEALLRSMFTPDVQDYLGQSRVVNAYIRGPAVELPSGPVDIVVGGEYVRGELTWTSPTDPTDASNFSYDRVAASAFSEVRVPILGDRANGKSGDVLAITGAVRYDHDEYFGGHTTPQYAIEWRPFETLLVRGAYAEAFKAPGLNYINFPERRFAGICCVNDPQHGGAATPYTFVYSGDPDLEPETGESRSVGLVWSPAALSGFEASASWWQINQVNRITTLSPQLIVNNESLFPGRVVRDPVTGVIQSVSNGFLNFGAMEVAGFDLGLSYQTRTQAGLFAPALRVSQMYRYDAAMIPGAPVTDRLGKATRDAWGPRWKGTASLAWQLGPYSANVSGRYVSTYLDYQDYAPSSRELGDFWSWDLSAKYQLGQLLGKSSHWSDASVQLAVVNLFDAGLPYSAFGDQGYDPAQYDIRGRFVSLSLGVRF